MLIVALVCAFLFYAIIYIIWSSNQQSLDSTGAWLSVINKMAFMPETLIFQILRGLIIIVTFYVVADSFFSGARKMKRRRKERQEAEEPMELKVKQFEK